jgi:hypothetical protein
MFLFEIFLNDHADLNDEIKFACLNFAHKIFFTIDALFNNALT